MMKTNLNCDFEKIYMEVVVKIDYLDKRKSICMNR